MKKTQGGFSMLKMVISIVLLIGVIMVGVCVCKYVSYKRMANTGKDIKSHIESGAGLPEATSTVSTEGWKVFINKKYNYSIKYPTNWYVEGEGNTDVEPTGDPKHPDYYGGFVSFSNYSQEQVQKYQADNGELTIPSDYISVNLSFTNADPYKTIVQYIESRKGAEYAPSSQENISLNGLFAVRQTRFNIVGIGGITPPNSTNVRARIDDKIVNIGYGFHAENKKVNEIANGVVVSFTYGTASLVNTSAQATSTSALLTYSNPDFGISIKYPKEFMMPSHEVNQYNQFYSDAAKGLVTELKLMTLTKLYSERVSERLSVRIGTTSPIVQNCSNLNETLSESPIVKTTAVINGQTFTMATSSDAALGGERGIITEYSAVRNGVCYALSTLVDYRSIEFIHGATDGTHATAEELKNEQDSIKAAQKEMENVVGTFTFM